MKKNKRLIIILLAVPILLLIPLIGMQFSSDVSWSLFDFLLMGVLLFGVGFIIELVLRKVLNKNNRIVLIIFILLAFILLWAELAVGIFGTPFAGS